MQRFFGIWLLLAVALLNCGSEATKYLVQSVKYPEAAWNESIQGVALVEFVVDTNGVVIDAQCVKGICASIEAESVRVLSGSPKWNPATQEGRKVKVRFVQPISYKLR